MDLLTTKHIEQSLEYYLDSQGQIFAEFKQQDSGCVSYGIDTSDGSYFVKYSQNKQGMTSLENAYKFHSKVKDPLLPKLHNRIEDPYGIALVYDWVYGDNLYDYTKGSSIQQITDPQSPISRFKALEMNKKLQALTRIFEFFVKVEEHGYVAVDFYDGCILYNFVTDKIYLVDLDEFHKGPFILQQARLPGSTRFMAPEEFQMGQRIDSTTNVFTLGRLATWVFVDHTTNIWMGPSLLQAVIRKATQSDKADRYQTVDRFFNAWLSHS